MGWVNFVRLAGRRLPLEALRSDPSRFSGVFSAARNADGFGQCLCRGGEDPLRLVIKCSAAGRFHLAGWPLEGPLHDGRCAFHHVDPSLSGLAKYTSAAIRQGSSGDVAIRVSQPLVCKLGAPEQPEPKSSASESGVVRRSVGLTGLLHFAWDSAGLNVWRARQRRRGWAQASAALREQTDRWVVSRRAGSEVVFVVPPFRREDANATAAAFEAWSAGLTSDKTQVRRGLIVGEVKADEATEFGFRYQLAHLGRRHVIYVDEKLDARWRRSFRTVFAAAGELAGGRRVGLFMVERTPRGYLRAVGGALMLVNDVYVPADSSHEVRMADALIAAGRSFVKPLRYDVEDGVFPDFALVDEDAVVEVWGMENDPAYLARKAEKLREYARRGTRVYSHSAGDPLPDVRLVQAPVA
ncbi:DUF1173 family protein [Nocardia sp. NPDC058518]|uniref:DUF1173 family protein n=1 Tax=Nocardia sp. NPDC058518 TaxID=3346534 RepID=UPI003654C289